jgi:hypothetical protein
MHTSSAGPLITLTTDFGASDHYVGTMKGVILSHCPGARLVDISHDVLPFSIYAGAYTIGQAAPFFPGGTIHVVVIDPGVGTSRRALLLQASSQYFIAPDNGVLSTIHLRDPHAVAREITNEDLFLSNMSATFHGRDVFAPVAAALASGHNQPADVGAVLPSITLLTGLEPRLTPTGAWEGIVLSVDHFGNVITNFRTSEFDTLAAEPFVISLAGKSVHSFYRTFGEALAGMCFAYFGSSGFVELGINQGSAAAHLGAQPGVAISLSR